MGESLVHPSTPRASLSQPHGSVEAIREECRAFLEGNLKLTLNMDKTHITHVNDGFTFLGHRIIRKRGPRGTMRPVSTIPREKSQSLARKLTAELSGNYHVNKIDMVETLNRQLAGWANFYQYTNFTSQVYLHLDRIVFWKLAHWLGRKYSTSIKSLMRKHVCCCRSKSAGICRDSVLAQ